MSSPSFITDRLEPVIKGDIIELEVCFTDADGIATDTDSIPQIEIRQPSANNSSAAGSIILALTSVGVQQSVDGLNNPITGRYKFSFQIPLTNFAGVWRDRWVALIGNKQVTQTFTFEVTEGGSVSIVSEDPPTRLGEKPKLNFSEEEIVNINILLEALRSTLKSNGVKEVVDPITGLVTLVPCTVFSDDELIQFLCISLTEFNSRPFVSNIRFSDIRVSQLWKYILVEGAHLLALGAQVLIEAGREFNVSDNGISFQPPPLSTAINNQFSARYTQYKQDLDLIKRNMKPGPRGLGTYRLTTSNVPATLRLRHLRARQII